MPSTPPPSFGFPEKPTLPFIQAREELYHAFFGRKSTVMHELQPLAPHVDVYIFEPEGPRTFFTLVTGGMSDIPMNAPENVDIRRAELILYAKEPKERYVELMRWLAHLVHDQRTWFTPGSTMTNGQPPSPIFEGSDADCYFFMPSPLEPDNTLAEKLRIERETVTFLWLVPVTMAECEFIRNNGADKFFDILDKNDHPLELNERRESYIPASKPSAKRRSWWKPWG